MSSTSSDFPLTKKFLQQYGDKGESWWGKVEGKYGESGRYYHTLNHVERMLGLTEVYKQQLSDHNAVALACIFHDIEYYPKETDNEEKSAEIFKDFGRDVNLDEATCNKIAGWIIATKKHSTEAIKGDANNSKDLLFFLDMDLEVLGWDEPDYAQYAEQIRKEYVHVPEKDFCLGRSKVLQGFLALSNIYATEEFRRKYSTQARANIASEIKRLQETL